MQAFVFQPSPVTGECFFSESSSFSTSSSSDESALAARSSSSDNTVVIAAVIPSVLVVLFILAAILGTLLFVHKRNKAKRAGANPLNDLENNSQYASVHPKKRGAGILGNLSRGGGGAKGENGDRFAIEFSELQFGEQIGQGSFGTVYKGVWRLTPVAIKVVNNVTAEQVEEFRREVELMRNIRPHVNVVQLLGVCCDDAHPLCIVTELLPKGSLHTYLTSEEGMEMTPEEMVHIAQGIAAGMQHLHTEQLVHRDLAARNVLLVENPGLEAKVADFGMARTLSSEGDQNKTISEMGPVRWMAPESINEQSYSTKSDVWSFGVVLWEIASHGATPYEDLELMQVPLQVVARNHRLEPPEDAPAIFVELISQCCATNPAQRPSFVEIHAKLSGALEQLE